MPSYAPMYYSPFEHYAKFLPNREEPTMPAPLSRSEPISTLAKDMSLRDHFASQALAGIIVNASSSMTAPKQAAWAYELADAMLAAREKR